MKITGIYSIRQISTGKRYIGSSVNIKRRWASHKSSLNRNLNFNPHLQNSWNKNGRDDFTFEILEDNVPENLLEDKENEYIVFYGIANKETNIFNNDRGFNIFWAGRTGCVNPTKYKKGKDHHLFGKTSTKKDKTFEEMYGLEKAIIWKKQISESQKGGPGRHITPHSEETKKKMSESKKNKPWSAARRAAQENRKQGV